MSSCDERTATPPPPPVTLTDQGETYLPLGKLLGPNSRAALGQLLDRLDAHHDEFIRQELGLEPSSSLAKLLAWKRISNPQDRVREYELALSGELLPSELRQDRKRSLTVRIRMTHLTLSLSHNFRVETDQNRAPQVQAQIPPAIQQVLINTFNPLLAVTLQQQIKQKAEQKLCQEQRLQQQQQCLQTVVQPNHVIQTLGTIFAPRLFPGV